MLRAVCIRAVPVEVSDDFLAIGQDANGIGDSSFFKYGVEQSDFIFVVLCQQEQISAHKIFKPPKHNVKETKMQVG